MNTTDTSTPQVTTILLSKTKNLIGIVFNIILIIFGLIIIYLTQIKILGIFLIIGSILLGLKFLKNYNDSSPQIIISNKGIETKTTQFYEWKNIKNIRITKETSLSDNYDASQYFFYLVYEFPNGAEKFSLMNLTLSPKDFENLLDCYTNLYKS